LIKNQKLKKMSEQLITEKLNELNLLTDMETGKPTIPVSIAIQEAENLYDRCSKDKDELVRAGLDWKLAEDMPLRIDALKVSQAKWEAEYKSYQDCQAEWKVAAPEAFSLRDELVHHFYHALYNIPTEYAKVQRIAEGGSNADMIQDLIALSELGMKHSEKLQGIGLDLSLLDTARSKSFELGKLLAKVNGASIDSSPVIDIRNKAYTHLKEAVDEIRRVGQYVYWRDEKKFAFYASQYVRKLNAPRKKTETPAEA
jgi:hypothetical protein